MSHWNQSGILPEVVTPTPYCVPVRDFSTLQAAARILRSRIDTDGDSVECEIGGIARALDQYISNMNADGSVTIPQGEHDGHTLLFLHLLSPLAQNRGKHLAVLDDAANDKPLLICVLLPECAFDLTEVAEAYDFTLEDHCEASGIIHEDSMYIDAPATFTLLLQHHPALLISLAFAIVIRPDEMTLKIREILLDLGDQLLSVDHGIAAQPFTEIHAGIVSEVHRVCTGLLIERRTIIISMLSPEHGEQDTQGYLRHLVCEAFDTLLTDEGMAFDRQRDRIVQALDEEDIGDVTPPDTFTEEGMEVTDDRSTLQAAIVMVLNRMQRLIRRVRSRVLKLADAIPIERA